MRILAPSEMLEKLKKNVGFKNDGSVEIAKNLEIDGKLKLNSGFEPIHTYSLEGADTTIEIYTENLLSTNQGISTYIFIGKLYDEIIIGRYQYDTAFRTLGAMGINYLEYDSIVYYAYDYNSSISIKSFAIYEDLNTKQDKLTLHSLTLTANSKTYNITLQSTNNLKVDSIADLRTILNINATTDSLITPVCASDLTSTACLQVTTALCKIGADNVTAVSDKVTAL